MTRVTSRVITSRLRGDSGQVTAFVVVMTAALLLMAGLVLDGGLALAAKTRALDVAQAAARVGAQELDLTEYRLTGTVRLDTSRAELAARDHLARVGVAGAVAATTRDITVTVRVRHRTQLLNLAGVGELTMTAEATAVPRHGITEPDNKAGTP